MFLKSRLPASFHDQFDEGDHKVTCPLMTSGAAQSALVVIGDAECETVTWVFSSLSPLPDGELPVSRLYTCDPRPSLEECSAVAGAP